MSRREFQQIGVRHLLMSEQPRKRVAPFLAHRSRKVFKVSMHRIGHHPLQYTRSFLGSPGRWNHGPIRGKPDKPKLSQRASRPGIPCRQCRHGALVKLVIGPRHRHQDVHVQQQQFRRCLLHRSTVEFAMPVSLVRLLERQTSGTAFQPGAPGPSPASIPSGRALTTLCRGALQTSGTSAWPPRIRLCPT